MAAGAPTSWAEVKAFLEIEERLNDEWQARVTVRLFRVGQWLVRTDRWWARAPRSAWWLVYRCWFDVVLGADIPPALECGVGVRFAHGGRGVVIHHRAVIGARATIYHRVTVGKLGPWEVPVLGDDVVLGAGCAVLGGVTLHDGASVGPHAVVVDDVPPLTSVVAPPPVALPRLRVLGDERRSGRGRVLRRVDEETSG